MKELQLSLKIRPTLFRALENQANRAAQVTAAKHTPPASAIPCTSIFLNTEFPATGDDLKILAFLRALDVLRQIGKEGRDVNAAIYAILASRLDNAGSIGAVRSQSTQPWLQNNVGAF
ncbi:hypothetical protein L6164_012329 [Bauhinia variegata]|uniref:Uncharacterized protein n=1 Tax=Bauhinia variegata TaxID=167791 RepID=A0ACB9PCL6_BAUVA|nr:hypothetical protein L6164_012329 [Bauhinia variegata]